MTALSLAGAVVGLGLLLLVFALRAAAAPASLAGIAAVRRGAAPSAAVGRPHAPPATSRPAGWRVRLGARLLRRAGLGAPVAARPDLARARPVVGGLPGQQGAARGCSACCSARCCCVVLAGQLGFTVSVGASRSGSRCCSAPSSACCPTSERRQEAAKRRQDFRHAIGAFLDLVSMNLAGGRGVPEALTRGRRDRRRLGRSADPRHAGLRPDQRLRPRGRRWARSVTRSASTSCATCPPRSAWSPTTAPRCASRWPPGRRALRRRELAEMEGQAGERSQSMLVAQMLLCGAFLIFLVFPAVRVMLGS